MRIEPHTRTRTEPCRCRQYVAAYTCSLPALDCTPFCPPAAFCMPPGPCCMRPVMPCRLLGRLLSRTLSNTIEHYTHVTHTYNHERLSVELGPHTHRALHMRLELLHAHRSAHSPPPRFEPRGVSYHTCTHASHLEHTPRASRTTHAPNLAQDGSDCRTLEGPGPQSCGL